MLYPTESEKNPVKQKNLNVIQIFGLAMCWSIIWRDACNTSLTNVHNSFASYASWSYVSANCGIWNAPKCMIYSSCCKTPDQHLLQNWYFLMLQFNKNVVSYSFVLGESFRALVQFTGWGGGGVGNQCNLWHLHLDTVGLHITWMGPKIHKHAKKKK